ncbi:MAG TPA: mechanosensitive ion channel family protein [Gemmatimonadales bacterium]|nr:mechanosensitive ion channel family protein [Gemmatimonadales bacterium]
MPLLLTPDWLQDLADFFSVEAATVVRTGARIVAIWVLAWLIIQLVGFIARRIEKRVDDGNDLITTQREKRGRTISQLLRGVGRIIAVLVAVLLTIQVFMPIGPILAGFGILGLAVSFGAQSLVKDIISGFFMLLENQFGVGDVIEAAGKSGSVERMSLRVVVLRDLQGRLHIIPNGEIKSVTNMTAGWARAVVDVAIGYDADLERALVVVNDEATRFAADPEWKSRFDGPIEVQGVEQLGDSAVVIRVLIRTVAGSQWAAAREFRRRIKLRLDREGIEIPFPQRRVHVTVDRNASDDDIATTAGSAGGA